MDLKTAIRILSHPVAILRDRILYDDELYGITKSIVIVATYMCVHFSCHNEEISFVWK